MKKLIIVADWASDSLTREEIHLAVDHCHKTGKVRGLLCRRCNLAISFLDESPTIHARARRYLLKHAIP